MWIKNGIIAFLSAVAINVISSIIYAKIEKVDIGTAFKNVWEIIIDFVIKVLTVRVQLWIILLVLLIYILTNYFIKRMKSYINKKSSDPEFMSFTAGVYKGINYKWQIVKSYDNKLKIENFRPVCKCGAELTKKDRYQNAYYPQEKLFCVNCEKIIESDYDYEVYEDALLYFNNLLSRKIEEHNNYLKHQNM